MYKESELLPISALQHYAFCKRQYALIHLEGIWSENVLTAEGRLLHERVHDSENSGMINGVLVIRSLPLKSMDLGLYGVADVVEFHQSDMGVELANVEGRYKPYPVEYKRGKSKANDCDRIQLCAQALCLEEMLNCAIKEASIFYGEPRRRETVDLNPILRMKTKLISEEIHKLLREGITPEPDYKNQCKRCSLINECNPKAVKKSAVKYWKDILANIGDDAL